jgi:hypothetical protein
LKEKADEKTFKKLVEELEDIEKDFETDVMTAQSEFEKTVTDNGAVADWKDLEHQIENDLKNMNRV